jgi:tetratricopeptide (TPR) repeat protein
MKRSFVFLVFIIASLVSISQSIPDSLRTKYDAAASSLEKGQILANYITALKGSSSEQLKILLPQLAYFSDKKDETGTAYTHLFIGILDIKMDDPNEALRHGIAAFKTFEEALDTFALLKNYTLIGNCYWFSGNLEQSLSEWKKGLSAARIFDAHYYCRYLNNIAGCFNEMRLPDSAMPYIQEALRVGYRNKDSLIISNCLEEMGQTYIAMGQNELGRTFLHQAMAYLRNINSFYFMYEASAAALHNEISQSFFNSAQYDSSLIYARRALSYKSPDFKAGYSRSYGLISQVFEKKNMRDSANEYFRRAAEIQNTILSDEKSKNIQNQLFKEELRQQELVMQKEELATRRRQNLDYALIALGIIFFTMAFLILSRSFITNEKLIRYLGILTLLLAFEFINLLAHTYLEELTNHSQVMVLLLLVGIAALLIPLHHRLEKWTIARLIEKNKKVRLAAAKLTIEKLEPKGKITESTE